MDILREMGVDANKATNGVWVVLDNVEGDHEVQDDEVEGRPAIKIARADNLQHQKALTKRLQNIARSNRSGNMEPETRQRIEAEALHGTVILDWKNLSAGPEGFAFTKENVIKAWTDITYAAFKDRVNALINHTELFRLQQEEEREKN